MVNGSGHPDVIVDAAMEAVWVSMNANIRMFFSISCMVSAACFPARRELQAMLADLANTGKLLDNLLWSLQESGYPVISTGHLKVQSMDDDVTVTTTQTITEMATPTTTSRHEVTQSTSASASSSTTQPMTLTSTTAGSGLFAKTVLLEVELTLSNVSTFSIAAFLRDVAEAVGVKADQVLLTSISYETSVVLSLDSLVTQEQVRHAVAIALSRPPENVSVSINPGRRRLASMHGRVLAAVTAQATVKTGSIESATDVSKTLADATAVGEALVEQGVNVSVVVSMLPLTKVRVVQRITFVGGLVPDTSLMEAAIAEKSGLSVSVLGVSVEESDFVDGGSARIFDIVVTCLLAFAALVFVLFLTGLCMKCRHQLQRPRTFSLDAVEVAQDSIEVRDLRVTADPLAHPQPS